MRSKYIFCRSEPVVAHSNYSNSPVFRAYCYLKAVRRAADSNRHSPKPKQRNEMRRVYRCGERIGTSSRRCTHAYTALEAKQKREKRWIKVLDFVMCPNAANNRAEKCWKRSQKQSERERENLHAQRTRLLDECNISSLLANKRDRRDAYTPCSSTFCMYQYLHRERNKNQNTVFSIKSGSSGRSVHLDF